MKKAVLLIACLWAGLAFAIAGSYTFTATPAYVDLSNMRSPITVTAIPAASTTITCYQSTTPGAFTTPGSATWSAISGLTSITANATVALASPYQALKCLDTVGTGSSTVEVNW